MNYIEQSVNEDVNHFQKGPVKKRDFPLKKAGVVMASQGWKHSTQMSYIEQHVVDHDERTNVGSEE